MFQDGGRGRAKGVGGLFDDGLLELHSPPLDFTLSAEKVCVSAQILVLGVLSIGCSMRTNAFVVVSSKKNSQSVQVYAH